jgi:hypothetical protein
MAKLEVEEERKFKELAYGLGCLAVKFVDPAKTGAPDRIVFCPNGRTIFFEFKRQGEEPRRDQLDYHKGLRALGFHVLVVYSAKEAATKLKVLLDEFQRRHP